jgi:hypothetical protein
MDPALSLERHGILGRFGVSVEAEYRRWLGRRIRPLGAMMAGASLVAWIAMSLVVDLTLGGQGHDLLTLNLVCWGLYVPVLIACLVYIRVSEHQQQYVALATVAVATSALGSLLLIGPALDLDAAVYLAAGTFFGSIAPLVLLPFRITVVVNAAIVAAALARATSTDHGDWTLSLTVMVIGMSVAALLVGPSKAIARALAAHHHRQRCENRTAAPADTSQPPEHGCHPHRAG